MTHLADLVDEVKAAMWDAYEGYVTRIPADRLDEMPFKQAKMEAQAIAALDAQLAWLARQPVAGDELVTECCMIFADDSLPNIRRKMEAVLTHLAARPVVPEVPEWVKELHLYRQADGTWSHGVVYGGQIEVAEPEPTLAEALAAALSGGNQDEQ